MLDKLRDEGTTNYEYFISTLINNIENIDELNRSIEPALSEGFIRDVYKRQLYDYEERYLESLKEHTSFY